MRLMQSSCWCSCHPVWGAFTPALRSQRRSSTDDVLMTSDPAVKLQCFTFFHTVLNDLGLFTHPLLIETSKDQGWHCCVHTGRPWRAYTAIWDADFLHGVFRLYPGYNGWEKPSCEHGHVLASDIYPSISVLVSLCFFNQNQWCQSHEALKSF